MDEFAAKVGQVCPETFHESVADAYRTAVALMGGLDSVGVAIWPFRAPSTAGQFLADILRADRVDNFSLDEHCHFLRIARDRGVDLPMKFLCAAVGYEAVPIEVANQEAAIARQMESAAALFDQAVTRLERINSANLVRGLRSDE